MEYLKNSIDTYLAENNPGYAVQLVGEWGSGKTFFVKQHLKDNMYYVSAFGVSDINEMYAELFCLMHKAKGRLKNFFLKIRNLKFTFFGATLPIGDGMSSLVTAIIKKDLKNDKVIVIDDVERSSIPKDIIFGFISNCLENYNCHIILLMNDIDSDNSLIEKTIGRRLKLTPDFYNVYDFFICDYKNKKYFIEHKDNIIDVFSKMDCKSLRILKRVLFEVDTIIKCIDKDYITKCSGIIFENLILFVSLSVLVKQGKVQVSKIKNRIEYMAHFLFDSQGDIEDKEDHDSVQEFVVLHRAFNGELDLASDFLNNNIIDEILEHGVFIEENIRNSIEDYIGKRDGSIEPWKIIYQLSHFSDDKVDEAMKQINFIMTNNKFIDLGHAMHNISAIIYVKECYCDLFNITDIDKYIKEYLEHLYTNTRIFLNDYSNHWFYHDFDASHGFSYISKDNDYFNEMIFFIKDKCRVYTENYIKEAGEKFNDLIINDFELAKDIIYTDDSDKRIYKENSVFKYCDPHLLSKKLMILSFDDCNVISDLFRCRYRDSQINFKLSDEYNWLENVVNSLILNNESNTGLAKVRINRVINNFKYILKK